MSQPSKPLIAVIFALVILAAGTILPTEEAFAQDQQVTLQSGWNLVSFSVEPADPDPAVVLAPIITTGQLDSIWAYDAVSGTWDRFPAAPDGSQLTSIEVGRGYWLKVSSPAAFTVVASTSPPAASNLLLEPGWNLVGFPIDEPTQYSSVFRDEPVGMIWRFDSILGFQGLQIIGGVPQLDPDFTTLDTGRGYWVFIEGSGQADLLPSLATSLPGDTDEPPLLTGGAPGIQIPFSPFTPGDINVGAALVPGDTFYDRPETQRAMVFLDNFDSRILGISNADPGVLRWKVRVEDPIEDPWLKIRQIDPATGDQVLTDEFDGVSASETDFVDLFADRNGLAPGTYQAVLLVETNAAGGSFPNEPGRSIPVVMNVEDLDGDYEVRVEIDLVDARAADLPNPRLFMSLYRDDLVTSGDDGRLKVGIDQERSLLYSSNVRLGGEIYADGTTRFAVNGSLTMDPAAPGVPIEPGNGNLFASTIVREITLIGERRPSNATEFLDLGPLDLVGDYRETIRGLTADPIYLSGTFKALKQGPEASVQDQVDLSGVCPGPVADADTTAFNFTVPSTETMIITGVDFSVDVNHPVPSQLTLTLTSPTGASAVLRDQLPGDFGLVTYDDDETPVDDLSLFRGLLSRTPAADTWTLGVVDNATGETGSIDVCDLKIRGTSVYSISGNVANAPPGSSVLLTGCGVVASTTTDASGNYQFDGLVDCRYLVTVQANGFVRESLAVVVAGDNESAIDLAPGVAPPDDPIIVKLPEACPPADQVFVAGEYDSCSSTPPLRFASLTTAAGAGALLPRAALSYVADSSTFDVDRPPLGNDGDEDTLEFGPGENGLTMTNQLNPGNPPVRDGVDPPIGSNSARAFIAIGGPVIGRSVRGNLALSIGANPGS